MPSRVIPTQASSPSLATVLVGNIYVQGQLQLILSNLAALGMRRLFAMAIATAVVFAALGMGANYVNKPAFETLYVGLERDDINRMGIVLSDAGIGYDVDAEGTTVLVETGKTSRARMILAEKDLPGSSGSGYELFDNLGSLGLTSFMQEVTRVRVLEGEVARSIQAINGIKAARVHIIQPDRSSFGSRNREATASVLIRTNGSKGRKVAFAIRHLVAAAVPNLSSENVTVLDASGQLLMAGEDPATSMMNSSISIQKMVEDQLRENISTALSPYLGVLNFRVTVQADINTDKSKTEETIFDPESRVERSVQVVKTQDTNSQQSASSPTSVAQNLPEAEASSSAGPVSSQNSERREETTNYELNSKKVATVSSGYTINKLSAAIVLNKQRIKEILGADATDAQMKARIEEIEKVARAAAGFDTKRGDIINVTAVEFIDELANVAIPEATITDKLVAQAGSFINAAAFLIVSVLLIFFGLRPLLALASKPSGEAIANLPAPPLNVETAIAPTGLGQIAAPVNGLPPIGEPSSLDNIPDDPFGEAAINSPFSNPGVAGSEPSQVLEQQLNADTDQLFAQMTQTPQDRLEGITAQDEELSAQILRRWTNAEAA